MLFSTDTASLPRERWGPCGEAYKAWLAGEVGEDGDILKAGLAEAFRSGLSEKGIYFDNAPAMGRQKPGGVVGYGSVEDEGIVIRDKESEGGFVVQHIGTHQGLFLLHYVRGIGDNYIKLAQGKLRMCT